MTAQDPIDAFVDDATTIPDDAVVFRRIHPDFIDWSVIDDLGRPRLTSQGFQDYPADMARAEFGLPGACMSVGVEAVLVSHGHGPSKMLEDYDDRYGVARLRAGDLRTLTRDDGATIAQGVMPNPTPAEPWHSVVFSQHAEKKNKTVQKKICQVAVWEIPPESR